MCGPYLHSDSNKLLKKVTTRRGTGWLHQLNTRLFLGGILFILRETDTTQVGEEQKEAERANPKQVLTWGSYSQNCETMT